MSRRPKFTSAACLALTAVLFGCAMEPKPLPPPKPPKVPYDTLITSDPDAVRCNVNGGTGRSVTVTTPRLVPMAELGAPVRIRCFGEGYWTTTVTVITGSRRPLLLRALDGEQITPANAPVRGPEVGPGGEFPRSVAVTLRRNAFESATARDVYYAEQLHAARLAWEPFIERAEEECETAAIPQKGRSAVSRPAACRQGLHRLQTLMHNELQLIEQQRRRSLIP